MKKLAAIMLALALVLTQLVVPTIAVGDDEITDPFEGLAIESIVTDSGRPLIKEYDGEWDECFHDDHYSSYFYYEFQYAEAFFTVTYEDGSQEVVDLPYGADYVVDTQIEDHWDVGVHQVEASYKGVEFTFELEVIENPIESITAVARKPLRQGIDSYVEYYYDEFDNEYEVETYDLYDADILFTITFNDGTVITGTDEEIYAQTGHWTYDLHWQDEDPLELGKNVCEFGFMNITFECEIEVVENPYKAIEISGETELFITFIGKNPADTYTTQIVDIYGEVEDAACFSGIFVTADGEEYQGWYIYKFENVSTIMMCEGVSVKIAGMQSNVLPFNIWYLFNTAMKNMSIIAAMYADIAPDVFGYDFRGIDIANGEYHIDDLVVLSMYYMAQEFADEDDDFYYITEDAATVSEYIAMSFGLENVDVTASKFYDAETGFVTVVLPIYTENVYLYDYMVSDNGTFSMSAYIFSDEELLDYDGVVTVYVDEVLGIEKIEFVDNTIPDDVLYGDLNNDGSLGALDVRFLLQYIADLREFTDDQVEMADFNNDGEVSALDVRYLLQMIAGIR